MTNFLELRQLLGVLGRRWWILLIGAILGAAAGYGYSARQEPVYEATTSIIVGPSLRAAEVQRADLQLSQALAMTYADVARRQLVLQGVVDTLGLERSWRSLRNEIRVRMVENTQLLEITAQGNSPELAQKIADEVARQLIELSPTSRADASELETQNYVRERMNSIRAMLDRAQSRIAELEEVMASNANFAADTYVSMQNEINTLDGLIVEWDSTYARLLTYAGNATTDNYLAVVEPAQARIDPVSPRTNLNTLLATVVGLLAAVALVFLLEYLDDTLKSAANVSETIDLATLGVVQVAKKRQLQHNVAFWYSGNLRAIEDYRLIRSKIQYLSGDWPRKIIIITCASDGVGKSIVLANLAVAMAEAGLSTIIVDADLRFPVQHKLFQVSNQQGLTNLLRSPDLDPGRFLLPTRDANLKVLPSGDLPPSPAELLASSQMVSVVFSRLAGMADVVLCDTPQAATLADASMLASQGDGVLFIVEAGQTRRALARHALQNLIQAGANVMGAVLTQPSSQLWPLPAAETLAVAGTARTEPAADLRR